MRPVYPQEVGTPLFCNLILTWHPQGPISLSPCSRFPIRVEPVRLLHTEQYNDPRRFFSAWISQIPDIQVPAMDSAFASNKRLSTDAATQRCRNGTCSWLARSSLVSGPCLLF